MDETRAVQLRDGFRLKPMRQFDKIPAKDDKLPIVMPHIAMSRMNGMDAAIRGAAHEKEELS